MRYSAVRIKALFVASDNVLERAVALTNRRIEGLTPSQLSRRRRNGILLLTMDESGRASTSIAGEEARSSGQLAREHDRLKLLLDINNATVSHLALDELLHAVSESLKLVIPHDISAIGLYDPAIGQLRPHALEYPDDLPFIGRGAPIPMEGTTAGVAFTSGQPVFINEPDFEKFNSDFSKKIQAAGFNSGGSIPLTAHGRKLGVLSIASRNRNAFSEDDIELLCQVANQIAIAVENSLNYEKARDAERQMAWARERSELLLEINNKIASSLDLRELFKAISACLRTVLHHDYADLAFYDAETDRMRLYAIDRADNVQFGREDVWVPVEGTPPGLAIRSRQTVVRARPDFVEFPSKSMKRAVDEGIRSGCTVPLISRERVLGVLNIASRREAAFTDDDGELLTQIGVQVAMAVENAINFEAVRSAELQTARERDRSKLLLNINNAIVSHLDLRELMYVVSSYLRNALRHDLVGLALYDPETNQLRASTYDFPDNQFLVKEGQPIPLEGSMTGLTFTSGKPVIVNRFDDERFPSEFTRRFREAGFKSGCCVPLIAHGRKLGTLGVTNYKEDVFSEDEMGLLVQIGNQIAIALENALAYREIESLKNKLSDEKLYLEEEINTAYGFEQLIGSSPGLKRILKQVETVAPTDSTVLIQGETGTGKELIARAIHSLSARRERTLVKLNCAAIPTGLLESELFGHEKGAFTGAIAQRIGRFELANRGTLFLDEVGEIPQELQPKLLRVLQEREFERLGSARTISVDARLVAATNRNLEQMVAERQFRDDLFYRLNVFPITIPPLRERREDIPLLVRFFASKFARRMKKQIETIPTESVAALQQYHWPGNIRELENFIERAVILAQGTQLHIPFTEMKLPPKAVVPVIPAATTIEASIAPASPSSASLESIERDHILRVLREANWVVGGPDGAAARLGLKRTTLQARMKKLGIGRGQGSGVGG